MEAVDIYSDLPYISISYWIVVHSEKSGSSIMNLFSGTSFLASSFKSRGYVSCLHAIATFLWKYACLSYYFLEYGVQDCSDNIEIGINL